MSDAGCYATHLDRIFEYTNTFYHMEPHLDIADFESSCRYRDLDFVITSDVLEHVLGPVSKSLKHLFSMLKPEGKLILSVPFVEGYETIEHFPHLNKFDIVHVGGAYALVNQRADGLLEVHRNLSFHGGPGSVLEMRIFGEGDLVANLAAAGFRDIEMLIPEDDSIGYSWDDHVEHVLANGRRSKSYVMVCSRAA